ncbi:MAG: outer membrane beta-barrel protein [Candidatus Aminicenantes bacterium]|nr:outer membrane beta-barrel protein [Candidatus Aminicenantes bacterium]
MQKTFKTLACISLLVFIFFTFIPSLQAQSYRTFKSEFDHIIENTKWKIGPFRLFPRIQLRDIGYDDNVYYQQEEEDQISDFRITAAPEINVHLLFRNYLIFNLQEIPAYVFYFEQKRERSWDNTFSPSFKLLLFHRFVLSGEYTHIRRKRRATSEFNVRTREISERYSASLFYETSRRTSIGLSYSQADIDYEDIDFPGQEARLSQILSRKEKDMGINLYYGIFSASRFFIKGSYTDYTFKSPDYRWRDSYSYQVSAGIEFPEIGRIRGRFSLGFKSFHPQSGESESFEGLIGDTEIQYEFWRIRLKMGYARDCHFSYWTSNIFFTEDQYSPGIFFYLTRSFRLDYEFRYSKMKYPEPLPILNPDGSVAELLRGDILRTHTAGFTVRLIENTGIGLKVNYWERESNLNYLERDRLFVYGYVTYEF